MLRFFRVNTSNTVPTTAPEALPVSEEKLDHLEAGNVVHATTGKHATHFHLPTVKTELLEKQDFVPATLAEEKMHKAMVIYESAKKAFEARISALQAHHDAMKQKNEEYFQAQTSELREKALRHVEVQRILKKQLEEKLMAVIREKEGQIEDLRDKLADLNATQAENGRIARHQGDQIHRLQVELVIERSLIGRLVGTSLDQLHQVELDHTNALQAAHNERASAVQKLQAQLTTLKTKYISLRFHASGAVSKAERQSALLHQQLIACEVQMCMTDMLDRLAPLREVSAPDIVELKTLSGPRPALLRKATTRPTVLPDALPVSEYETNLQNVDKEVNAAHNSTAPKPDRRGFDFHIDANVGKAGDSIQSLRVRAQDDVALLSMQYNAAVNAVISEKKRLVASQAELLVGGDQLIDAQALAKHDELQTEYNRLVQAKDSLLELKIETEARLAMLLDQIAELGADEPTANSAAIVSASADAESVSGTVLSNAAVLDMQVMAVQRKQQTKEMESMEDVLVQMKAELEASSAKVLAAEDEKAVLRQQMQELIAEKRTDVLARLTQELTQARSDMTEQSAMVAKLRKESTQAAEKQRELELVLKMAQEELQVHDEMSKAGVGMDAQVAALRDVIAKQRAEVASKAKAATAGWNAAATADEEKTKAEDHAYDRGYQEAMNKRQSDNVAITQALEQKDQRITELVLEVQAAEGRVRAAQKDTEAVQAALRDSQVEVADAIASLAASGSGMVPVSDLERVREDLDTAQEEIISLTERVEQMQTEAKVAAQTIAVYEQLRSAASSVPQTRSMVVAPSTPVAESVSRDLTSKLADVLALARNTIASGTTLWKQNKREECHQEYLVAVESAVSKLYSDELLSPLKEALEASRSQDKPKAAVTLRKALDKLLVDGKTPQAKKAEDDAAALGQTSTSGTPLTPGKNGRVLKKTGTMSASLSASGPLVQELESQLIGLRLQLQEAQRDKDQARLEAQMQRDAAIAAGESVSQPKAGEDGTSASLLSRAKAAEKQVDVLKRQIAQMAASMNATTTSVSKSAVGKDKDKDLQRDLTVANVEVRRLQRVVKVLEEQLKNGGGVGGAGGPAPESKRGQIQAEKAAAKKFKEFEASSKKAAAALERRATSAEKALQKLQEEAGPAVEERDTLRIKVRDLTKAAAELEGLRGQVAEIPRLREESAQLSRELAVTAESLKKESALRKKYKNDLEDMKGAIRVYARCRPMAKYEIERGCNTVAQFTSDETLTVQSDRGLKEFAFDQVFPPTSKQETVFEDTRMLVESCLDGYNVCLFAYGQTGSGKTFTMTGSPALPGLTPRAIDEIFRLKDERAALQISVKCYFVELYLDTIVDLLYILDNKGSKEEPPKLDIKLDSKKMVYISNCTIKEAADASQLMNLFNRGNSERHVGATKMNADSSRSHSIFAVLIESYDPRTKRTVTGKLSLVDLAGSERADKTGATGDRLKEGIAINKSLSALGDVISALSSGEKIIPYRNSKLTQMMQDSLGGNAKTLMFVNFSPADYNADETVAALNYAARVKLITNDANKAAESAEMGRLKNIIKKLKSGQELDQDEQAAIGQ